jgi:FkbM family methyltransferase
MTRDRVKQWVRSYATVNALVWRVRATISRRANHRAQARFASELRRLSLHRERPVFVKVGANDGVSGDPCGLILSKYGWQGVLIEPVPYCRSELASTFGDESRFAIEPVAVGRERGTASFHYVDESAGDELPGLPPYWNQLGSFDREHFAKYVSGNLEPYVRTIDIDVMPLADILERHRLGSFDLLHIDTEGHDFEVIRSMDLRAAVPALVLIETRHLSESDQQELRILLESAGYEVFDAGGDYVATLALRGGAETATPAQAMSEDPSGGERSSPGT